MNVTDYHLIKLALLDSLIVPGADLCLECRVVFVFSTKWTGGKKCTV